MWYQTNNLVQKLMKSIPWCSQGFWCHSAYAPAESNDWLSHLHIFRKPQIVGKNELRAIFNLPAWMVV
jgi:hypothetical protein